MIFFYFGCKFTCIVFVVLSCVTTLNVVSLSYNKDFKLLQNMRYKIEPNEKNIPPRPNITITLTAKPDPFETKDPTTQAKVTLRRDLFSNENGEVIYYAFLLAQKDSCEKPRYGNWNGLDWPNIPNWKEANSSYQVTPPKWKPFLYSFRNGLPEISTFILGDGACYESGYCNIPLKEKTKYAFKIRAFTLSGYQDTDIIFFETLENLPVRWIISILGGVFAVTTAAVFISIFDFGWIKRLKVLPGKKAKDSLSPIPQALSLKGFVKYSQELRNTQGRLGNEFYLLDTLSSDVSTLCLHAQRVDNRKKNRESNILPFDMTRVKLSIIDDDPSTDYINASFIKGYSQEIEYIACQGPKEETCHDFYRMILEQNVELIVMLTELVENECEKCYKYYPEKGKILRIRDVIISCKTVDELEFCTKRTLVVIRGDKRVNLTHLHFKNWNDFECPESPEHVLKFCELIHKIPRKGYIVVHCSSGAGRTGTLIAIDILLQNVKNSNKVSVFYTVLNLRQQRVYMVQTVAQLGFIYECVCQAVEGLSMKPKESI